MKRLKKIVSILLTAVMVLAMCVPVMAAENEAVSNDTGHAYKAYQIFRGEQTDSESATLTEIVWGDGVDGSGIVNALLSNQNYPELSEITDTVKQANYIAKVLGDNNTNTSLAEEFAKVVAQNLTENATDIKADDKKVNLHAGYYLFVDQTQNPTKPGDPKLNDVIGLSLLQVTRNGSITLTKKVDKPSVEKKVYEDKVSDSTYGQGYNDTADYNIGDDVPFKLIGTVVDMSKFSTYKYVFHDTLAKSLRLNQNSVKVVVASAKNANTENSSEVVDITTSASISKSDQSLTVSFDDLKSVRDVRSGEFIIVTYTAKLLFNAGIGKSGIANTNQVNLEYSNNPNHGGEGETGKTPDDKVIVFTYELDGTKTNAANNNEGLQGAKFVLYKMDGTTKKYAELDDEHRVTRWSDSATVPETSVIESAAGGKFNVVGLDAGTYYLDETEAPKGFNKLTAPITIIITANTTNGQEGKGVQNELTEIKVKVGENLEETGNIENGKVPVTIQNNKGSVLPETGGIGTTIFYVVGIVLMLGAGVLLITKRRMDAKH